MGKKTRFVALIKMVSLSLALLGSWVFLGNYISKNKKSPGYNGRYYSHDFVMGTASSYEIYTDGKDGRKVAEQINTAIKAIDEANISWRSEESELYKLNNSYDVDSWYECSDELCYVIEKSLEICKSTDGALDITIRPLANLWGIEDGDKDSFVVPAAEVVGECRSQVGFEHIHYEQGRIKFDIPDMIVDFGAVGKGYALDIAKGYLEKNKVEGAVISVGGSILVYGSKPDGQSFKIGIRNPKGGIDDIIGYVSVASNQNLCISTSGDYEKYIEKDGIRYHHIIDRKNGAPADSGLSSVTVVCEDGLVSDALSTACFILGEEESKPVLDKYNASAIFIDEDNNISTYGDVDFTVN